MKIKNGNVYISKVSGSLVVAKCNDDSISSNVFSGYELINSDLINNWAKDNFAEYHVDDIKPNKNTPTNVGGSKGDFVLEDNQEYSIPEGYEIVVKNNKVKIRKKVSYYKTCIDQDFFYNLSAMVYEDGYVLMRSDLDNECKNANIVYLKTSKDSFSDDPELKTYNWEVSDRDYFKAIYDLSFKENSLPEKILKIISE